MNLYLISQDVNNDYNTFDSAVVAAESEDAARMIHPGGDFYQRHYPHNLTLTRSYEWCAPEHVKVDLIGVADAAITEPCVICSSYNAG